MKWLIGLAKSPLDSSRPALKQSAIHKAESYAEEQPHFSTGSNFPGRQFAIYEFPRKTDGYEKWVDFASKFWHCECICGLSENTFKDRYNRWCKKAGYNYSAEKAETLYAESCGHVDTLPKNNATKLLVVQAISQLKNTFSSHVNFFTACAQ